MAIGGAEAAGILARSLAGWIQRIAGPVTDQIKLFVASTSGHAADGLERLLPPGTAPLSRYTIT
jgi:hypothetical protein